MFSYTVMIRTLGLAGERYARTLASIAAQTIAPAEVVVVIPHGYELPRERLGCERFVRCDKGMVIQRAVGFDNVATPFTLSLDDDVEFDATFVEDMYNELVNADADFVSPAIIQPSGRPAISHEGKTSRVGNFLDYLSGITWKGDISPYAVKVARSAGYITAREIDESRVYEMQTGHGTVIFGRTDRLKALDLGAERWLEDTVYALPDDQVIYYKLYLQGCRHIYCPKLRLHHLDASTSVKGMKMYDMVYTKARNFLIFWHRFIYSPHRNVLNVMSIARRMAYSLTVSAVSGLRHGDFRVFATYFRGYRDALRYIRSERYKQLPPISKS